MKKAQGLLMLVNCKSNHATSFLQGPPWLQQKAERSSELTGPPKAMLAPVSCLILTPPFGPVTSIQDL